MNRALFSAWLEGSLRLLAPFIVLAAVARGVLNPTIVGESLSNAAADHYALPMIMTLVSIFLTKKISVRFQTKKAQPSSSYPHSGGSSAGRPGRPSLRHLF